MAVPVCTALCNSNHIQTYPITDLAPTKTITLSGAATNPSILEWEWSVLPLDANTKGGYPAGSTVYTGTKGDFTNGKATVQNPTCVLDVAGGYCFTLRARNADGWSSPKYPTGDGTSCQAIVYILTASGARLPPENMFRYSDDLNLSVNQMTPAGVPGTTIEMLKVTAGSQTVSSASFTDLTNISGTFTAPVAGLYLVHIQVMGLTGGGSDLGHFRAVFDAAGTPLYVGADDVYSMIYSSSTTRLGGSIRGTVTLTAGTHTIKLQALKSVGTSVITDTYTSFRVDGTLISGSGAGGVVKTAAAVTSNPTTISSATFADITGASVSITVAANETVLLCAQGSAYAAGAYTAWLQWTDGSNNVLVDKSTGAVASGTGIVVNIDWTIPYTFTTAGSYTVKLRGKQSSGNWGIYDGAIAVLQFRGGLTPVQKDGVSVIDTPAAYNFTGANIAVTSVSSVATVAVSPNLLKDPYFFSTGPYGLTLSHATGYVMTRGVQFGVRIAGSKCLGAQFYTGATGNPHDVKVTLWKNDGTSLATKTVSCAGAGTYVATFDTPYSFAAGDIGHTLFVISSCETADGDSYIAAINGIIDAPFAVGQSWFARSMKAMYKTGDNFPNTGFDTTNGAPIDPTITFTPLTP